MADPVKVVGLFGQPVITGEVNANAIECADDLLAQIRTGQVVGFAYVALHSDETTTSGWAGIMHYRKIIGTIEVMKHQLVKRDLDD